MTYDHYHILMKYIIGACHAKMNRRLQTKSSQGYMDSLMQVRTFTFRNDPTLNENDHSLDTNFLDTFIPVFQHVPDLFLLEIPNIMNVYTKHKEQQPWQLYNEDTYLEFHGIFQYLLKAFADNLKLLVVAISRGTQAPDKVQGYIAMIFLVGDTLSKLARGSAIKRYLANIEASLIDQRDNPVAPPEDNDNDFDPDVQVLRTRVIAAKDATRSVIQPKRDNYLDWLQLMVAHFDAVNIVMRYLAKSRTQSIVINVLVGPRVTTDFLHWERLFATSSSFIPEDANSKFSNNDILNYLTNIHSLNKNDSALLRGITTVISNLEEIETVGARERRRALAAATQQLDTLLAQPPTPAPSGDWNDIITKTRTALTLYRSIKITNKERAEDRAQGFAEMLQGFRSLLAQYGTLSSSRQLPFTLEPHNKFLGTLHCESVLASLLDSRSRKEMEQDECCRDILEQTEVNLVSLPTFYREILIHLMTGLWPCDWCFETLLPRMRIFLVLAFYQQAAVHRSRRSHNRQGVHLTKLDSLSDRGQNESSFWLSVARRDSQAYGRHFQQEPYSILWLSKTVN